MSFFANSGVAWPQHENDTRRAGAQSLEAFSKVWHALADMERRGESTFSDVELSDTANSLQSAVQIYTQLAEEFRNINLDPMTPAEFDLAGLNLSMREFYDARLYLAPESFYVLFLESRINLGKLYKELAQRTKNFASSLRAFEAQRSNVDLSPQVFQFMKQLEALAILGRVVAVLNQRAGRTE